MAITKINTPELFDFSATNTALQLPTGDTASRPTSPSTGEWRFNSELKYVEYYDGADWFQIDTEANILVGSENFNVNTYFGNGATQVIDAKFNEAANFNGSSSEINLGTSSNFSITTTGALSGSMWVKTTDTSTSYLISKADDASTNYEWAVEYNGSQLQLNVFNTSDVVASSTGYNTTTINDGNWHHVAFVIVNNTSVSLYIDGGTPATSTSWSGTAASFSIPTLIGHFGGIPAATAWWNGSIDQVRIFNTALTAAQAEDLYTDETTTTAATLNFPAGAGCIAAYQLDGNGDDISTNYNGTTTDIGYTGLEFQPDFVWIKRRDNAIGNTNNLLFDSVRGAGERLMSNVTNAESTETDELTSFNSNGFTVGADASTNGSGGSIVAWNWKAGGAAVSNTDGTITSQVSANTAAGFSIVKWTGNGSTNIETIGQGLSSAPEMVIWRNIDRVRNWNVYNSFGLGSADWGYLNLTDAFNNTNNPAYIMNQTAPTSTVFTIYNNAGNGNTANYNNEDYIAYCFHSVAGYSKIGSYTGSGTSDFDINVGFRPRFLLIKSTTSSENWAMSDSTRNPGTPPYAAYRNLYANLSNSEGVTSPPATNSYVEYRATGFGFTAAMINAGTNTAYWSNGNTYIYLAIA